MFMNYKRLTILCGHYGSGKTNIAVNMAYDLRSQRDNVAIADLDIVNPYFRSRDSESDFRERGIRLICSEFASSNVDLPSMPADLYAITDDRSLSVILDIGGDDRGAYALGRLRDAILAEGDFDMYMVVNRYRPLTPDAASTVEVMREIEAACGIPFTGIINNSNIARETAAADVLDSMAYADEVSRLSGLPLVCTTVTEELFDELKDQISPLFSLHLQAKII